MHGNNIDFVTLKKAPINAIMELKNGIVHATHTVLITSVVLMRILIVDRYSFRYGVNLHALLMSSRFLIILQNNKN
jgi:hypothetical protein